MNPQSANWHTKICLISLLALFLLLSAHCFHIFGFNKTVRSIKATPLLCPSAWTLILQLQKGSDELKTRTRNWSWSTWLGPMEYPRFHLDLFLLSEKWQGQTQLIFHGWKSDNHFPRRQKTLMVYKKLYISSRISAPLFIGHLHEEGLYGFL